VADSSWKDYDAHWWHFGGCLVYYLHYYDGGDDDVRGENEDGEEKDWAAMKKYHWHFLLKKVLYWY